MRVFRLKIRTEVGWITQYFSSVYNARQSLKLFETGLHPKIILSSDITDVIVHEKIVDLHGDFDEQRQKL